MSFVIFLICCDKYLVVLLWRAVLWIVLNVNKQFALSPGAPVSSSQELQGAVRLREFNLLGYFNFETNICVIDSDSRNQGV